jgi:septal ring factor EnvC (AmiA/AmiB activator)
MRRASLFVAMALLVIVHKAGRAEGVPSSTISEGRVRAPGEAAGLTASPAPETAQAAQAALSTLRADLKEKQATLAALATQERSLVDGLGDLDETLARLDDESRAVARRLASLLSEIGTIERTTGRDEKELQALRERLRQRLRQLAVDGEGGTVRALLGAEGFTELALRRRLLAQLANNDSRLVGDVRRAANHIAAQRQLLRQRAAEASAMRSLLAEQQTLLQATRDERAQTLESVRRERASVQRSAAALVEKRRALQTLMNRIVEAAQPRTKTTGRRAGILRSGLPWPVAEGVVIRRFGTTVDADSHAEIVSNGIEFRSAPGTPVYAVADGDVVHAGWVRGFGRVVIVDHGEGHHTLYAHLARSDVGVGDAVARGGQVGEVGDTESQNGAKLYFELREHGHPRDPTPFLRR